MPPRVRTRLPVLTHLLLKHLCCVLPAFLISAARVFAQDPAVALPPVDFNREIRPILSNHCFPCHGADEDSRAAELRLDQRDEALRRGAINADVPADSTILQRILAKDSAERMPPVDGGKPLTPQQTELLQRWIVSGGHYSEHWAFQPIQRPEVPETSSDPWVRNPIDAFVLKRLHQASLLPSPEADRATLIRRATLDVTGLLPSIEEADSFLSDSSPDAWERTVDRLLASPHYGERWGRHWLDQARYADSNGYTIDGPRVMWPWRDWVIAAHNADMPFDQFTIEQLAGDLLPGATVSQRVASAFHRNTMINEEGGVKPDQYRHEALIDRVSTTGAVWLGLTLGCAQCHSHKFDPITHEDYYRFYAFFNAAADANNVGESIEVREGELFGWTELQRRQLTELQSLLQEKTELEKNSVSQSPPNSVDWKWQSAPITAVRASGSIILRIHDDNTLLVQSEPEARDTLSVTFRRPETFAADQGITAVRLRVLTHPSLPHNGPGTASNGNFVLTDVSLRSGIAEQRFVRAWADHSQPGYPVDHAIDDKSDTGWAINVDAKQAAAGVRMNAPHEAVFLPAEPVMFSDDLLIAVLRHDLNKNYLIGHFAMDVSSVQPPEVSAETAIAARLAEVKSRISELEALLPGKGRPVRQMVMKDSASPPQTFLLTRGDFLHPDKELGPLMPGIPVVLDPDRSSSRFKDRLDLAKWLVSPENPLTARVTVNRVWGRYFGRGLVDTENDFGYQGTPPTHPELLDWLAAELTASGWSMKHLHRTILTSAVYRQASGFAESPAVKASIAADPDNFLLGRQMRLRVEAEIVRDLAVTASGLLDRRIGGPGVHLPQPDGIYDFTQNKKDWPTATGTDRFRRTMYTMFYRSAPYPLLSTFDAPDFSTVCTRRARSNTPLQSLTMANDQVFTELAQGLARSIRGDSSLKSDGQRARRMFRICLTREPSESELDVLLDYFSRELSRFRSAPENAARFAQTTAMDTDAAEAAAWSSVARVLFNTDEFLTRN